MKFKIWFSPRMKTTILLIKSSKKEKEEKKEELVEIEGAKEKTI